MLNNRGGIESDLTITQLSDTVFFAVVPGATLDNRLTVQPVPADTAAAEPDAVTPDAAAVPGDDRLRFDDHERGAPIVPHPQQPDPQQAVR